MMNFKQNEEAVSPVIGVILMVAITVILAAVIAAFVFGMTGNVQTQKNVAIGLQKDGGNLQVTIQGGVDLPTLQYLKISVDGGANIYTQKSGATLKADSTPANLGEGGLTVGKVFIGDNIMSKTTQKRVIVVGHFSDGQEQMLVDRTL